VVVKLTNSLAALQYSDFRNLLASRFFSNLAIQMQVLVISWQVWHLTHNPLALGLIGLSEFLPFAALALVGGRLADWYDRKRIVVIGEILHVTSSLALLTVLSAPQPNLICIYLVIAATGVIRSFLWSSTQAYAQMSVPQAVYPRAAAWNSSVWEVSAISGPAIGGALYAWAGPTTALGAVALLMSIATGFALRMGSQRAGARPSEPAGESLLVGLRFVLSRQVLFGALALDMFAVFFGGVTALLPIFAERMGVGPVGLGWLRASPAIGAIGMALYQTSRAPYQNVGRTLMRVVIFYGLTIIAFAFSRSLWLSMALLIAGGMADNVSVIIRHSIVQAFTPDHMRGRVSAVNGIFIGSSNELGAFESGVAARLLGVTPSVIFGGCMTLVTVAVVFWRAPQLRRLKSIPR
jgi:MFS family permease